MKKKELLAPAGDMECLKQAVYNGADAIYIACKNFGARKFATNFTNEEIVEAIKFCHLYGVKLYVTMNTLVKNSEVDDFLKQAYFLHKNGVDALIVQDFGMICLLREKYPNLEVHASTQANTSSYDTCKLFYDLGVKRVVFSRELDIDQIDSIDIPIEKEAFIHGALCISYSGCCLMSSMLGGRSGNRGECAGCCRMPFTLTKGNEKLRKEYLLSTKELNTTEYIDRLLNSSIDSFKIEGRMKSPLYVGFITRLYRKLIDGEKFDLEKEISKLKTIFNREFTKGRLFFENDKDLMNTTSPNHIGLKIGKVVEINKDKIKIQVNDGEVINQYDAIRFLGNNKGLIINFLYDEKMKLTNSCSGICYIDNKIGLEEVCDVSKTQDYLLGKEFDNTNRKKISINYRVKAKYEEELFVEISDGKHTCSVSVDCIDKAINAPTDRETIMRQLSKLGDSVYEVEEFDIKMDPDIFIQIGMLNKVRRELVEKLNELRISDIPEVVENEVNFVKEDNSTNKGICAYVRTREQLDTCIKLQLDKIYVDNTELYEEYKDLNNVYLVIDRCFFDIKSKLRDKSFVSDYSNYNNYDISGNYSLNVTNIYTGYYLTKLGFNTIPLSVELNEYELDEFINLYNNKFGSINYEVLLYGRIMNMVIKGNILDINSNSYEYNLIDFKDRKFPVYFDGINTYVLNYEKRNLVKKDYLGFIRLDFYEEDSNMIYEIVNKYK